MVLCKNAEQKAVDKEQRGRDRSQSRRVKERALRGMDREQESGTEREGGQRREEGRGDAAHVVATVPKSKGELGDRD